MANIKSSKKDILRIKRNRQRIKPILTLVRRILRETRESISSYIKDSSLENKNKINLMILKFEKFGNKAASKGAFKRKTILSKLRRLNEQRKKIFA